MFDGRYIYYPPAQLADNFVRVDTTSTFTDTTSWQAFDFTTLITDAPLSGSAAYFRSGAFDGKYAYFWWVRGSTFLRYDTTAPFATKGSWTVSNPPALATAGNSAMGIFDGRYVYVTSFSDLVARYDTTADFAADNSYQSFTTTTINPNATNNGCAAFDGRYFYIAPNNGSIMLRFDAKPVAGLPATYSGSQF